MLVTLTPNLEETERRLAVAKENNFEFVPQHHASWILKTGIYRCNFDHNFSDAEFMERLDGWDMNKELLSQRPLPDNFNELFIQPYGVADNVEQIEEFYKTQIEDPVNKYIIALTPVFQDLENKGKCDGWRWHKWGEYIGSLDHKCEYLDDEDFGADFKYVICFHLYKLIL